MATRDISDMRPTIDQAAFCELLGSIVWPNGGRRGIGKLSAASRRAIEIVMVMELTTHSARREINALLCTLLHGSVEKPRLAQKFLAGISGINGNAPVSEIANILPEAVVRSECSGCSLDK